MFEYISLINRYEWVVVLVAFVVSAQSPNIRWLTGTIMVLKTIDVLTVDIFLQWGGWFYIAISFLDLSIVLSILLRQKTASYIANLEIPCFSQLAQKSAQYYKLTSNEIGLVILYMISIIVNFASSIEHVIRRNSEYNPMFIYNHYSQSKLALTFLCVMIVCSLAINGANNLYRDKRKN
ncbi:hypothetical protein HQQ94_10205 [Shewanella sp. VB17]|uniref:hypothetical protein n=1 Tax=Shewanella sp. VB17 TaxID=2739432 RepID=UPI001564F418|nr:hypothetical protein [Shewanella sp. VB17]NRD73615.1 hypothetical protein [Shewanella sp. VB17]